MAPPSTSPSIEAADRELAERKMAESQAAEEQRLRKVRDAEIKAVQAEAKRSDSMRKAAEAKAKQEETTLKAAEEEAQRKMADYTKTREEQQRKIREAELKAVQEEAKRNKTSPTKGGDGGFLSALLGGWQNVKSAYTALSGSKSTQGKASSIVQDAPVAKAEEAVPAAETAPSKPQVHFEEAKGEDPVPSTDEGKQHSPAKRAFPRLVIGAIVVGSVVAGARALQIGGNLSPMKSPRSRHGR